MTLIMLLSLLSLFWWRNSVITMLLCLEATLIVVYLMSSLSFNSSLLFTLLTFLSIMVIGSSLGLSMLVTISRSHLNVLTSPIWLMN
uniref:NADH dehydrogenase subunit 4L n=1 Tax=Hypochilus thorelli TaxID=139869 RepID=B2CKU0_HYPTH|nr:NADH dehydrogenase subunit 4L [Hypochilus thorelli]ACA62652.1 NADH dehydrogenase subunit 4L [Hypochilus thorelli]